MNDSTALVFLDTETTGLSLDDDIWEFAAIRRESDGSERELHLFLRHDVSKCNALPTSFLADHQARFPMSIGIDWHEDAVRQDDAAYCIDEFLQDKPHIVGAVPNFDTERLAILLGRHTHGWRAPWHYHLIDVENLTVGFLAAKGEILRPPWDSDALSAALGITVPEDERHTAMGDVRWAMRIYDAVMGTTR
jgi:hypothetical protein